MSEETGLKLTRRVVVRIEVDPEADTVAVLAPENDNLAYYEILLALDFAYAAVTKKIQKEVDNPTNPVLH